MHPVPERGTRNRAARLCVPRVSRMADSCVVGMHGPRGTIIDGAIRTVLFMIVLIIHIKNTEQSCQALGAMIGVGQLRGMNAAAKNGFREELIRERLIW